MTTKNPSTPYAIGKRLRAAREQAGLSQAQVAVMMKLHRPTISQMEAGDRNLRPVEISQLAKLYSVKKDWILAGESSAGIQGDPRVELAARELSKLKKQDLDVLLALLSRLRSAKESET